MKKIRHSVLLAHESFTFSATHFISFLPPGRSDIQLIEPLHGHNFRVTVKIEGPLNELGYVVEFVTAEGILRSILDKYNHKVLLPNNPSFLTYTQHPREIEVFSTVDFRHWLFPLADIKMINGSNATTEVIATEQARFFYNTLADFGGFGGSKPEEFSLEYSLEESQGMNAIVKL